MEIYYILYIYVIFSYIYYIVVTNCKYKNTLCSSSIDIVKYSNNRKSCNLNCKLKSNYTFPKYPNDTCFVKKLYIEKEGKFFSLFNLNITHYSYDNKYLYSAFVLVLIIYLMR